MSLINSVLGFLPGAVESIATGNPLGALSSVGGFFQNQAKNDERSALMQKQYDYNMAMAQQTHQWNIEDWERNNLYNSPKAQKERLLEAGLNPLFSDPTAGLSSSAVTSTPLETSPAPSSDMSSVASLMSAQNQAALTDAQIKNLEQDTRAKKFDADIKQNDAQWRDRMNGATYKGKMTDIDFTLTKEMESDANRAYLWKLCTQIDHANEKIDSDIAVNKMYIDKMMSEKKVNEQTAHKIFLDNLMKSETWETQKKLLVAELHMTEAQVTSFLSQAALCNSQQEMVNLANEFAEKTMSYRVENTRRQTDLTNKQIEYTNNMSQLAYWNHNNARFAYNFAVEHKEDLFAAQMVGTLMTAGAAMVGAGALIGDKTVTSSSTVSNATSPVTVKGFGQ